MRHKLPGHIETPIGQIGGIGITLTSMAPEARDCLDIAMERWREQKAGMTRQPTDEVYAFAYWLLRYSGLVVPARQAPEPPEEERVSASKTAVGFITWWNEAYGSHIVNPEHSKEWVVPASNAYDAGRESRQAELDHAKRVMQAARDILDRYECDFPNEEAETDCGHCARCELRIALEAPEPPEEGR